MTRFARAKGSKASNERLPNEATPWHVMKQQLEDNISSKNSQPEKAKTAKQLLNEKDDPFYCDTTGNVNNDWAEFERPKMEKSKKDTAKEKHKSTVTPITKKNKKKLENTALNNGNGSIQDLADSDIKIAPKMKSKKQKSDTAFTESAEVIVDSIKVENAEPDSTVTPKKKSKKRKSDISSTESADVAVDSMKAEAVNNAEPDSTIPPKKKSKKRKSDASAVGSAEPLVEHSEKVELDNEAGSEPKKKEKKKRNNKSIESSAAESTKIGELAKEREKNENEKVERSKEVSEKMSKRQKRNQKRKNKISSNEAIADEISSGKKVEARVPGSFDAAGNEWSNNVNFGKQQKFVKKLSDPANVDQVWGGKDFKKSMNHTNGPESNAVKRKALKIRDDKEHKRRKPDVGSIKCTINGMDVEIVKYDGFPVKKEDAERLKELRQQMILKGIPKSEIDAAMKLERRKAEKALARVRKQVCFHCRKAGHNLSDCPELGEGESATGICFKCGSTEHTHFECKVTKKQEYGFASCFICREQGHIAKQCPDNPKGLYPQGGSCKICGDVTHLRKDCPDLTKEKEESAITLNTIADSTLESLDEDITKKVTSDDSQKSKRKVVKF